MREKPLRNWLVFSAIVAVVLLIANFAVIARNTIHMQRDSAWLMHTYDAMVGPERVLSLAKDAETGQRGFLITAQERYLEPYHASSPDYLARAEQQPSEKPDV